MKLACRLFGHQYAKATKGLTAINKVPVFRCRCGEEWYPLFRMGTFTRLTKRDQLLPYRIAS